MQVELGTGQKGPAGTKSQVRTHLCQTLRERGGMRVEGGREKMKMWSPQLLAQEK